MAQVLAKIFNNKKYQGGSSQGKSQAKSNSRWHVPRFSKENINLVIFKDHTVKGRQPILDSRSVRRVTLQDLLCEKCRRLRIPSKRSVRQYIKDRCTQCPGIYANPSSLPKYKSVRASNKNDLPLIGEMVFGTAPLANSGTTVKVHSLRNPHQIMLSLVFPFIKRCEDTTQSADFDELSLDFFESSIFGLPKRGSESNLSSLGSSSVGSVPVDMPRTESGWGSDNSLNLSVSSNSLQTPIPSPSASSTTSIVSGNRLCMIRRLRRSWNRSLPQYNSRSIKSSSSGGNTSLESSDSPASECGHGAPLRKRGTRIGLAVMFGLDEFDDSRRDFENFFFSHITLIEGQLAQLRLAVERSACEPRDRVEIFIMEALEKFQQNVYDLYTAPRLHSPVWLSMMATSSQRLRICDKFVQEFILLIDRYDTRSTSYFVSSLLTGVLMYHLAWVPTVTPSGEAHSSYADKHSPKWLDMLAKSHPYNPLWAQLSDMYGAIGIPPRLARTIVCGKKTDTILKFLFVLSYFIRCSEIHETFDECYDEEFMLSQIESAVGDICIESMEKEVTNEDEFVFVDPPCSSPYLGDTESDSGLVSQFTGQSKNTRQFVDGTTPDTESGFIEPQPGNKTPLADVNHVPSSSPADKVREWICTSQLSNTPPTSSTGNSRPTSFPTNSSMHKSGTTSTLVNSEPSPCMSPRSPPGIVELARSPTDSKTENVRAVGRAACDSYSPEVTPTEGNREGKTSSSESEKTTATLRVNLVRLFSSETAIDEFSEYFDGKPPTLHRQTSQLSNQSNSMYNEYFEDSDIQEGLESLSQRLEMTEGEVLTPSCSTPSGNRNVLFKVLKETGFHHTQVSSSVNSSGGGISNPNDSSQPTDASATSSKQSVSRTSSNTNTCQPLPLSEDQYRPRGFSVGMQSKSSRCSTPQTIKNGETTTPTSEVRVRHLSACPTILSDGEDPFSSYTEIDMPRSKRVSKLADTSISTTSFGRQQLASFSDHYLSDFVLHGTSDENVIPKVQEDLASAVAHSVLEDPISEAVCVVADTERWSVHVCSSMSKQPKPLRAAHLVSNMIETVTSLSKLKMSSEFIMHHMEDRLQEMYFKSRMLAEYIKSRKKVDMDELGAMFGLESNDIRFLLSVTSTHSTLNLHGIF